MRKWIRRILRSVARVPKRVRCEFRGHEFVDWYYTITAPDGRKRIGTGQSCWNCNTSWPESVKDIDVAQGVTT